MSQSVPVAPRARRRLGGQLRARCLRAALALPIAAGALLAGTTTAQAGGYPPNDPFYAAPADLASKPAGDVLRSRAVKIKLAPGIDVPFKAYQVLYRSTDLQEKPIASVATIMLPLTRPGNPAERRLVSYQTAYDGLSPACQPSYSLTTGKVALQGAEVILMGHLLSRGWTVVTSDYEGPDNAWGVGVTTGRGVLDGVRATERFAPAGLSAGAATKVGMYGYSGGGQATAWANELAPGYAPELNIVGAAMGGMGPNLTTVMKNLDGQILSGIGLAGMEGVVRGYPDVKLDDYLNNRGKSVFRKLRTTNSCITDFALSFPFVKLRSLTNVPDLRNIPVFKAMADENSLGKAVPKASTFVYHTYFDQMGGYNDVKALVRKYCAGGTPVQFVTGYKEEHTMQAFSMPFKAQYWLAERFNGVPTISNCATT